MDLWRRRGAPPPVVPGDGFPSPRERRAAARPYRHSHQPRHIRHSRAGRPLHNRHSRDGGNPGAAGMGSRLHGNDGQPRVPTVIPINPELHISVIPAQEDPCTTVIPATAGIQGRRGDGNPSPPPLDSRRRGNDGCAGVFLRGNDGYVWVDGNDGRDARPPVVPVETGTHPRRPWIPAVAGMTVVQGSSCAGMTDM